MRVIPAKPCLMCGHDEHVLTTATESGALDVKWTCVQCSQVQEAYVRINRDDFPPEVVELLDTLGPKEQ